ncbi:glycosyltransferase [Lacticaseibacillus absianus]|uniref:glycosyltransferase n=1 Tax=Lacticaseibacillus absianus TaxID=2729623 RepID=UPI0015CE234D|nr:glycosyltransferase [Lacticaseibacillus absianus]
MIFFINAAMQPQKSGIEHAELKRFELFNNHEVMSQFVIRDWDPKLHSHAALAGIDDRHLIGMFDYFQQALAVESTPMTAADLDLGVLNTHLEEDEANHRSLVYDADNKLVARVNYFNETTTVRSVELFDSYLNLYRVDNYDERGFVSLSQHYTPDNNIGTETWYTPNGDPVLETFNRDNMAKNFGKTGWFLRDWHGQDFVFDSIEELTKHFFDDLNEDNWSEAHPNVFILDRSHLGDWGLTDLKLPAYTVMHLHNSHTGDAQDPETATLNNHYEYAINAIDDYDAVVSATQRQTDDVRRRFAPRAELFTIPVGVVPDAVLNEPRVPVAERQFGKVVAFARIAWEKRLEDLVKAVGIARQTVPELTLDLYGYADSSDNYKARRAVEDAIQAYGLEDVVQLKGYTTDVAKIEREAMVFGLTSRMEGFNLAILEGISHGLIGLTYDVNYGPNEIVQDGHNGRVVPFGDNEALAHALVTIMQSRQLAQEYSTGAYDSAERYSEANVWAAWQSLLDDADKRWPVKLAAARLTTTR